VKAWENNRKRRYYRWIDLLTIWEYKGRLWRSIYTFKCTFTEGNTWDEL